MKPIKTIFLRLSLPLPILCTVLLALVFQNFCFAPTDIIKLYCTNGRIQCSVPQPCSSCIMKYHRSVKNVVAAKMTWICWYECVVCMCVEKWMQVCKCVHSFWDLKVYVYACVSVYDCVWEREKERDRERNLDKML